LRPTQHVVGSQKAAPFTSFRGFHFVPAEAQHGFADHRQVLGGFNGGGTLTGQDFFCKSSNQDTQQGYFIPKDDAFGGLQTSAFGKGEVFGVEAVLGQRLMALGTSLMQLVAAQLEGVGVAGLTAALSFYRPFGWNNSVCSCGHI